MPTTIYTNEDVVKEIKRTNLLTQRNNTLLEAILAKVSAVLTVTVVVPNAPPQYTGPTEILDGVVGQTRALEGFDPDGDVIAWSMDESPLATISPTGILTFTEAGEGAITVWLDDGKA